MANILIFSKDLPYPLDKGNTLRVFHPCRQLAQAHTCILVTFGEPNAQVRALQRQNVFREIHLIRPSSGPRSIWRHIRWSNTNYYKLSLPDFYQRTVQFLKGQVERHGIHAVIVFPAVLSEFVVPLTGVAKIADSCDSMTLTYKRFLEGQKKRMSPRRKVITWLTLQRYRQYEKRLPEQHDRVISISPADLNQLRDLNPGAAHKLRRIPNGIPAELLEHTPPEPEIENAIIFWGNLKFPPNYTAVRYFYRNVYQPYLAQHQIKWYIVGSNADKSIRSMAAANPNILVTGFVDRLYDLAARIPVMINPMQIGSGLKNKVLEAFALGRLVVSTSMGVEAIVGAQPGLHYLQADNPQEFAQAVLSYLSNRSERRKIGSQARRLAAERYTWDRVGEEWRRVLEEITLS